MNMKKLAATVTITLFASIICYFFATKIIFPQADKEPAATQSQELDNKQDVETIPSQGYSLIANQKGSGGVATPTKSQHNERIENIVVSLDETANYSGTFKLLPSSVLNLKVGDKITFELDDNTHSMTLKDISHDTPKTEFYDFKGEDGSDNYFIYFPGSGEGYLSVYAPEFSFESMVDKNGHGSYSNVTAAIKDGAINPEYCIVLYGDE